MSKNYDRIATVTIDLNAPIVDDTSFDNLLLIGPPPKVAPEKAPPKVGAYSSLDEVTEAGWSILGDDADPIGLAAQVAYSQSPTASTIYIAPLQLSEAAIDAGEAIEHIAQVGKKSVGTGSVQGCKLAADYNKRTITLTLEGPLTGVSGTGVFAAIQQLGGEGYKFKIEDKPITSLADFQKTTAYTSANALTEGKADVQFTAHVLKGKAEVPYGITIRYPAAAHKSDPVPEYTKEDLGDPASELEDAVLAVQRAQDVSGWYVVCTAGIDKAEYPAIAAYVETQEKMFAYTELDFFNNSDSPEASVEDIYLRTLGVYGKETADQADKDIPAANRYINVAFVTKWLNYQSGSETAAFKTLQGVVPSDLSTTQANQLEDANLNYFITVGNKNVTMNGKVIGDEWCDIIRFRDWLKNDMQVRVANLFVTRPKIPYTDPGISLVQNQMIASLNAGVQAGGIAPDEYDEDGTLIPSYTTSVPTAASLSPSERASRRLTRCRFTARLAGAIHFAELTGTLGYEI